MNATLNSARWKKISVLFVLLQGVLYGIHDPLAKLAYQEVPVPVFLFLRYLLAAGFFLTLWGREIFRELKCTPVKTYLLPCLCMSFAYVCINLALQRTQATTVAFLRSMSALFAPLLTVLFKRQRYTLRDFLLQALMLAGLALMFFTDGRFQLDPGGAFALAGALLVAGELVFGADSLRQIRPATLSCMQAVSSAAVCGVLAAADGSFAGADWAAFMRPDIAGILLYAGLGCVAGGYLLQNVALSHVPARLVGVLQCAYPLTTAVAAPLILGERLPGGRLAGAGVILVCIVLESLLRGRRAGDSLRAGKCS